MVQPDTGSSSPPDLPSFIRYWLTLGEEEEEEEVVLEERDTLDFF